MKLLLLGGPRFLGYHIIEAALERGHRITLFNRGKTYPDLFPELDKLRGDRDGNLDALEGRSWDAAIDTSGYIPRLVRASAELLADAVGHYTFISSISVYANPDQQTIDEKSPTAKLDDASTEEITGATYGPLKALCERAAEDAMPGRVLNLRPGLIIGPRDPTDRFTYWLVRIARGGEVLAPDSPDVPTQVIDVRDLAGWMIHMIEENQTGLYNATGPVSPYRFGRVLETCRDVLKSQAQFTWVEEALLLEHEVVPFVEMPLWVPKESQSMMQIKVEKAVKAGLEFRPLSESVKDTMAWFRRLPEDYELKAGMKPDREAMLLKKWREDGLA